MTDEAFRGGRGPRIRWVWAVAGLVGLEVVVIAAAVAWVAVYSYVLEPNRSLADYQAYARSASPIVSLVVGMPAFFAAGRLLRRRLGADAGRTAAALGGLYLAFELGVLLVYGGDPGYNLGMVGMVVANVTTKLAAFVAGAWAGRAALSQGRGLAA